MQCTPDSSTCGGSVCGAGPGQADGM
jgi:hypothetical protein